MNLPHIPPTCPGQDYQLNIKQEQIEGAKLFKSRLELINHCRSLLPNDPTICELGVYNGDLSRELFQIFKPHKFYLVDTDTDKIDPTIKLHPRAVIKHGLSWEILNKLPDYSIDYLYVDADHSAYGVRNDIIAAHVKIKPGGIIQFNDYCTFSPGENIPYGVLNLVNSYIENHNVTIIGLSLDRSGYHDIAIGCQGKNHVSNYDIAQNGQ